MTLLRTTGEQALSSQRSSGLGGSPIQDHEDRTESDEGPVRRTIRERLPHAEHHGGCVRSILLAVGLLGPAQAGAADLLTSVDEAYASRQLRRTPFDPRTARDLPAEEARFLEALFSLTDEAVRLDTDARRWLASDGRRGLHVVGYVERIDAVRSRLVGSRRPRA